MGGSRRQRKRNTAGGEEHEDAATWHGISPALIWLVASSALVVVISPPRSSELPILEQRRFDPIQLLLRDDVSSISKMYQQESFHHEQPQQQQHDQYAPPKDFFYPQFNRPQGLRWRDDSRMMSTATVMPILTERSASPFGRSGASTSSRASSSPSSSSSQFNDSPSLEDMELIDVLWRSDIAGEKGTRPIALADQYECDLQTLTEKSTVAPLSVEENARYEDLAKSYYQDFYPSFNNHHNKYQQNQMKQMQMVPEEHHHHHQRERRHVQEEQLPTDKELADILDDMSHPDSELNQMFSTQNPIINNASLAEAIVYTQQNITELQELQDPNNQLTIQTLPSSSSTLPESLFNSTDAVTVEQWLPTEMGPADVFPQSNYLYVGMQNDSMHTVVSNGHVDYDHSYQAPAQTPLSPLVIGGGSSTPGGVQTQTSPTSATVTATATASLYDSYRHQHPRHSFSDCTTDTSTPCSRLSSESPRYNSESSSASSESRFYGKLVPSSGSRVERPHTPTKIHRVVPLSNGQRKRGRQSKDEQLASENALPVSAMQISEMTLSDLQQVLKNENLSEYQRQLIRKIRRRGKNKVAARTCRQRRTDRHDKTFSRSMY